MYNFYRERWLVDRYAGTLEAAFGQVPCVDDVGSGQLVALTVAPDPADLSCDTPWLAAGTVPPPATDDHPFPYLREAQVPAFYLLTIGLIVLTSLALVRTVAGSLRPMGGGGLVEYAALMTGYQALLFVVGGLYGAAWFLRRGALAGPELGG